MPRSDASRRFVIWTIMLVALSAGVLQFGLFGVRPVTNAPRDEFSPALAPAGRGWYRVAAIKPTPSFSGRAVVTDLWWNPAQGAIAAATAFVAGIVVCWIVLACQQSGARSSLGTEYRGQGRLGAGLHYGTAWLALMFPAAIIAALRLVAEVSVVAAWPVVVPPLALCTVAAMIGFVSVAGYCFGLIRMAATIPVMVRERTVVFFAFWSPLIMAFWVVVTGLGIHFWMRLLVQELNLAW